jgi:hypothetical protein
MMFRYDGRHFQFCKILSISFDIFYEDMNDLSMGEMLSLHFDIPITLSYLLSWSILPLNYAYVVYFFHKPTL